MSSPCMVVNPNVRTENIVVNLVRALVRACLARYLPASRGNLGCNLGEILGHKPFAGGQLALVTSKREMEEMSIPVVTVGGAMVSN